MGNYFFLIFILTILITRVALFIYPVSSPTIGSLHLHHYMYGLVGIFLGLLLQSVLIYAVGFGLFIDEVTYLLIGGKTHKDNYSAVSLLGTLCLVVVAFLLKDYLILPLLQ